jgi:hypothetical protein
MGSTLGLWTKTPSVGKRLPCVYVELKGRFKNKVRRLMVMGIISFVFA